MYKCRSTDIDDRNSAASHMDKILSQKIDSEFTDIKLSKEYSGTAKELSGQREQRTRVIVLCPPAADWKNRMNLFWSDSDRDNSRLMICSQTYPQLLVNNDLQPSKPPNDS
jgi:hypothetical protein